MTLPGFVKFDGMSKNAIAAIPQFLTTIKSHSKINPVLSRDLEEILTLGGVEIRALVSHLRVLYYPIASDSKGYYYAEKASELETTIKHIEGRAKKLLMVKKGLMEAQAKLNQLQGELL